jgi:glycine/D-amino acid oxidase-like deaminating enzyme
VIETNADGLPYIGQQVVHQFTGYPGNGMTFGTPAGAMACDERWAGSNP